MTLSPISVLRFLISEGFDSNLILHSRGTILMSIGDFPESLSQRILVVGIISVRRSCVALCRRMAPGRALAGVVLLAAGAGVPSHDARCVHGCTSADQGSVQSERGQSKTHIVC